MTEKPMETYFPNIIAELRGFAVFMMDTEGTILTWNMGCQLMKGYRAEEAIGQNYRILFPDFLREKGLPEEERRIALETGRYETENWRRPKDGKLFWAFVVLTRITDDQGKVVGFVKITQDQSEKKKFHDQLQAKAEDFQRLNAELSGFAATASHDLRAPIQNIEGLSLLLRKELEEEGLGNQEVFSLVDAIHRSAVKFKGVITEMATSAREEAEGYAYLAIGEVAEEVKLLLSGDIEKTGAVFREDYAGAPFIRYPRKHIRSILHNLITNALKYRVDGRRPEIGIRTAVEGTYTVLEVSDNGRGMKEEDKKRIFTMHHRLEEGKEVEGTGVGLGLVARIVDGNRGKVEIETQVDEGSTFRIYLR